MKQVSRQAAQAFKAGKAFKKGNTSVVVTDRYTELKLHGNTIAVKFEDGSVTVSNAGWPTSTTKERLNALEGVSVNQCAFQWYLNGEKWDGEWRVV